MLNALIMVLLFVTSLFLILLVLIQRGRGGGLAGAFGGLGGQSAFGTKAGDLFTRVTIVVAAFWIILCAASVKLLTDTSPLAPTLGPASTTLPGSAGGTAPSGTTPGAAGAGKETPAAAPATGTPATGTPAAAPAADAPAAAPAGEPKSEAAK